jgi:hypothetical protein
MSPNSLLAMLNYAGVDNRLTANRPGPKRQLMDSISDWVALIASAGIACLAIFQILLAAGRPYGAAAFGGAITVLPPKLRWASGISSALFCGAFYIVLAEADLFGVARRTTFVDVATWIFVTIFGLSTIANISSHSRWERRLMAPIALVLTICCAALALGR